MSELEKHERTKDPELSKKVGDFIIDLYNLEINTNNAVRKRLPDSREAMKFVHDMSELIRGIGTSYLLEGKEFRLELSPDTTDTPLRRDLAEGVLDNYLELLKDGSKEQKQDPDINKTTSSVILGGDFQLEESWENDSISFALTNKPNA